jgi:hypothetical protein
MIGPKLAYPFGIVHFASKISGRFIYNLCIRHNFNKDPPPPPASYILLQTLGYIESLDTKCAGGKKVKYKPKVIQ